MGFDDDPLARALTGTPEGRAFVAGGPLTPDPIVDAGAWPLRPGADGPEPGALGAPAAERVHRERE